MDKIVAVVGIMCLSFAGTSTAQTPGQTAPPKIPAFGNILSLRSAPSSEKPAVPLENGIGERITATGSPKYGLDWSPDGEWIAYEEEGDIWVISSAGRAGGAEPYNLTGDIDEYCLDPSFAPDNSGVLFSRWNSTTNELTVDFIDLTGSVHQVLINGAVAGVMSGDGRYLAYLVAETSDLAVYDYSTGSNKVVVKGDYDFGRMCFLPDDKTIVFGKLVGEDSRLFTVPATGGDPVQLTRNPGDHDYPDASPLGEWVMYTDWNMNTLVAYNMRADKIVRVNKDLQLAHILGRFSPDGSLFAYILFNADGTGSDVFVAEFPFVSGGEESGIVLNTPQGGEKLTVGSEFPITWTSSGLTSLLIEYSTDGGSTWNLIAGNVPASDGEYPWTVPDKTSETCLVRITGETDTAVPLTAMSESYFTIAPQPYLRLSSPNGGEEWDIGSEQYITWDARDVAILYIEYSTDDGATWKEIAGGIDATTKSFRWTVPEDPSTTCRVRISDSGNIDVFSMSYAKFTIREPVVEKTLRIVVPNYSVEWEVGSVQRIEWQSKNIGKVDILYAVDVSEKWMEIATGVDASLQSFDWTIPDTPSTSCRVLIAETIDGTWGMTAKSYSSFTIKEVVQEEPFLRIVSPNGGEEWEVGSEQKIAWESRNVSKVNLSISFNGGQTWMSIATGVDASPGAYAWTLPTNASDQCRVRISDASGSGVESVSYANFSITPKAYINILSPEPGEVVAAGSVYTIVWEFYGVDKFAIQYRPNPDKRWLVVALDVDISITATEGRYDWTVPETPTDSCQLRIVSSADAAVVALSKPFAIMDKSIKVVTPNGGEVWDAGSFQNIVLEANNVASFNLSYSPDNGANWQSIVKNYSADSNVTASTRRSFEWTVPDSPSSECLIRVRDADDPAFWDRSDGPFTIEKAAQPTVTVLSPNGGEQWQPGGQYEIRWESQGLDNVQIWYTTDDGIHWNDVVISAPAAGGLYVWTVPDGVDSDRCYISVGDPDNNDNFDNSDGPFTIAPAGEGPFVDLTSPDGGDVYVTGEELDIWWDAAGVASVNIILSTDGGTTWRPVANNVPADDGEYWWMIPADVVSDRCIIRISSSDDKSITDWSQAVFTITSEGEEPSVDLTSPDGGDVYVTGEELDIWWDAAGVSSVNILISTDGGTKWGPVANNVPADDGEFWWTIPEGFESMRCLVLIVSSADQAIRDFSQAFFTIEPAEPGPFIELVRPAGGEELIGGRDYEIQWNSEGVSTVIIGYTTDGGTTEVPIAGNVDASLGSFMWKVPTDVTSSDCYLYIQDMSDEEVYDLNLTPFTITAGRKASLELLSPTGGETLIGGQAFDITWRSEGVSLVYIFYAVDVTETSINPQPIAVNVDATLGSYTWTVPANVTSSSCFLYIADMNDDTIEDMNETAFTITRQDEQRSIEVTVPGGGERWDAGSTQVIQWNSTGVQNVRIQYSKDGGNSWVNIIQKTGALTGSYSWTIPDEASSDRCRIRISDSVDTAFFDDSDSDFEILENPANTDALIAIDTSLAEPGVQGNVPVEHIGGSTFVGFALYADSWRTSRAYTIKMTWDSGLAAFRRDASFLSANGEKLNVNGAIINLPDENNILLADSGTYDLEVIADAAGRFEANVRRTSVGVSRLREGLLYVAVFRTAQEFGTGDVLDVTVEVTVTDKLGTRKTLEPKVFRVIGEDYVESFIEVNSPVGGELWKEGTTKDILWTSSQVQRVNIEYSADNAASWNPVASDIDATTGSYAWQVPGTVSDECLVRISDASNAQVNGVSAGTFSITSSNYIQITSPSGGDIWTVNSEKEIQWEFKGVDSFRLEITYDGGGSWEVIEGTVTATTGLYAWTVPDRPSAQCRLRVTDKVNPDITSTSDTFEIIQPGVSIAHTTIPEQRENEEIPFVATVTASAEIGSVTLYYNFMGAVDQYSIAMEKKDENVYECKIPVGVFIAPGIEYYIVAKDVNGIEARAPVDVGYYSISALVSDVKSTAPVAGGSEQTSYRMISIPLALSQNSIVDQLKNTLPVGDYGTSWRLFRYPAGSDSPREYPDTEPFEPGRSFWLITTSDFTLTTPEGTTVSTDGPFRIELKSGWNDIANPWMFDISWDDISNPGNAELSALYQYEGAWSDPTDPPKKMEAWKGYAVRNMESSSRYIFLNPSKGSGKPVVEQYEPALWTLSIAARAGEALDTANHLGVRFEAETTWDRYDHVEPPPVGKYVSVSFPHRDWTTYPCDYTVDFRPPAETVSWDFVVKTNIPGETVDVELLGAEALPAGLEYRLFDGETGEELTTAGAGFSFRSGSGVTERRFTLVVSGGEFERPETDSVEPAPFVTAVAYPNPFNPMTTIRYELSRGARVRVTVFNSLGQIVSAYDPGYREAGAHEIVFEADELTSGLYFYRIDAGYSVATGKMLYMK